MYSSSAVLGGGRGGEAKSDAKMNKTKITQTKKKATACEQKETRHSIVTDL